MPEMIGGNYRNTPGETKTTEETHPKEEEVSNKRCSYMDFSMCKPPTYDGELDSVKLYNWIVEMEMAFYACQCLESQRVNFAITTLKQDALDWWLEWKDNTSSKLLERMTWEEFVERVKERFCSKDEIRDLEREFMDLKKDKMTVKEYNAKFRKLLSFSRRLAPDDETKVDYYKRGLPWNYKLSIGNPRNLNQVMRKAREIEKTFGERDQERVGNKRKNDDHKVGKSVTDGKKPRSEGRSMSAPTWTNNRDDVVCHRCNKKGHIASKCPTVKCFECNEMGHIAPNCPNKTGEKGGESERREKGNKSRAFQITNKEAREEEDVFSGTFLVDYHPTLVFILNLEQLILSLPMSPILSCESVNKI